MRVVRFSQEDTVIYPYIVLNGDPNGILKFTQMFGGDGDINIAFHEILIYIQLYIQIIYILFTYQ